MTTYLAVILLISTTTSIMQATTLFTELNRNEAPISQLELLTNYFAPARPPHIRQPQTQSSSTEAQQPCTEQTRRGIKRKREAPTSTRLTP